MPAKDRTATEDAKAVSAESKTDRILVADEISQEGIDVMSASLSVDYLPKITPEELLKVIPDYQGLLVRSLSLIHI